MVFDKTSIRNGLVVLALVGVAFASAPARAGGRCKVTDPTGTPLNIRDMSKNIIGTIANGKIVHVLRYGHDDAGKPWANVATPSGRPLGWVYREFISCY